MSKTCSRCKSKRVASVMAKCTDMCTVNYRGKTHSGYVPNCSIGAGDYIEIEYCLGCGQIQGSFPAEDLDCWDDEPSTGFDTVGECGTYHEG